jgi:hypothetical protein
VKPRLIDEAPMWWRLAGVLIPLAHVAVFLWLVVR